MRASSALIMAELADSVSSIHTLADCATAGTDLFGVADVLQREGTLRRALTDASSDGDAKAGLATAVFAESVGSQAQGILAEAVRRRWAVSVDLPTVLQHLAVRALVRSAGTRESQQVGDELFSVLRLLDETPALQASLANTARSTEDRRDLLHGLLENKVLESTLTLVDWAVDISERREDNVRSVVEEFQQTAADALDERIAVVHAARDLSDGERRRLASTLTTQYGRTVRLQVLVEPALIGGLRVEIGDDVIDGTVTSRLDEARRRLAG